jgi:hypothetical protein
MTWLVRLLVKQKNDKNEYFKINLGNANIVIKNVAPHIRYTERFLSGKFNKNHSVCVL